MQIKGKFDIKRGENQKYPIFGIRRRAYTGRRRRREEKNRRKKKKKPRKVWNLYGNAMILYGNYLGMDC